MHVKATLVRQVDLEDRAAVALASKGGVADEALQRLSQRLDVFFIEVSRRLVQRQDAAVAGERLS